MIEAVLPPRAAFLYLCATSCPMRIGSRITSTPQALRCLEGNLITSTPRALWCLEGTTLSNRGQRPRNICHPTIPLPGGQYARGWDGLSLFIALRWMQRPERVMVGLTENIQACLRDFQMGTASMARKRHLASTTRGFCGFCLMTLVTTGLIRSIRIIRGRKGIQRTGVFPCLSPCDGCKDPKG